MLSNLLSLLFSSRSSSQINALSSLEDRKLGPKLMLLEGTLISEVSLAGFVWSRMSAATNPLLFFSSQLCLEPCSYHSSTWACTEEMLSSLLALFPLLQVRDM